MTSVPPRTPTNALSKLRRATRRLAPTGRAGGGAPAPVTDRFTEPIPPLAPTDPPGATIVLLNDCRDQLNYGANALVDGLIRILRTSTPAATILPIPSHWLVDTAHGFGAFVDDGVGLRQPKASYPAVADQFETLADEWMAGRGGRDASEFLHRFERADVVVLNGEGSIYRTNLSAVRELFLAWLAKTRLGIPTVYVNGGIHLTGVMPLLPAMVRTTLPTLDAVAVREQPSLRNLLEYLPDLDARLFPDSAFAFTPDDARSSDAVEAVRRQLGGSPYFCFDPGAMPVDARPGGNSALHQLVVTLEQNAIRAVFISSGPGDRYIEAVAGETGALYVDAITDYRRFMALVSGAQFLVSGRYHNVILAAIMGCPSIALGSTSHKVHGACEMLENVVGSPYDGTALRRDLESIAHRASTYVQDRAGWADRLQEVCARRRAEVTGLGELVNDVLRSRE